MMLRSPRRLNKLILPLPLLQTLLSHSSGYHPETIFVKNFVSVEESFLNCLEAHPFGNSTASVTTSRLYNAFLFLIINMVYYLRPKKK